ncbi:polypeptide N-acetylgalactosaminyltransferase 15 [Pelobates cultripes]|uniref:Polypeptide N-acetylgalactosaminyltransferase n=1 Tax=Pelobates cultripes TaxID=61616 RepID=A0AAD1VZS8_PELCU|nr:polypeptide N-acetylgalactosaminyltransferase 15 [Pelobates cultripes]
MLLRKRCRSLLCQLQLFVLMLGMLLLLLMITVLDPISHSVGTSRDPYPHHNEVDDGWPAMGLFLERDNNRQGYKVEVLSPLSSLRDEGLIAMKMSGPAQGLDRVRRKMYKIVGQPKKKNEEDIPSVVCVTQKGNALNRQGLDSSASQRIPLHRKIPEGRHPLCLHQSYHEKLPTASVIISFHDEAWSTLLRTVHSVLDNSPRNVVKEIILVDDLSQQGQLKSALSEYISRLGGLKLIRSNKRLGAYGARKLGAARATGEVLVFMESHCECHKGWLEPLLNRILDNRNRIVSPVLDTINWKTYEYYYSADLRQGVFDWNLDFHWVTLPEHEEKVRQSPIIPFRSPIISGHVVAIDRHYFQNIGGFDTGINFWGVENLELSIRVWLCGGLVEIIPCSRVGHIYQNNSTSNTLPNEAVLRNKIRIAEVWMDSYKDIFYQHVGKELPITKIEKAEINEREQLRLRLGCKEFQWFLDNIHPGINTTLSVLGSSGQMFNLDAGFCMDYKFSHEISGQPVELSNCADTITQIFEYNLKEILYKSARSLCLDVRHERIIIENCTILGEPARKPLWNFSEAGLVKHIPSGKCIEPINRNPGTTLLLKPCNHQRKQLWKIIPL